MESFFSGLILGWSLIVAIGAQNVWVLSQSMAGANRLAVSLSCIICDVLLIVVGVFAAKELTSLIPPLVPWLTIGGVLMLSYIAFTAAYRAYNGTSGLTSKNIRLEGWKLTVVQALAISLLNPHVYLDTVVLLGSIGALQPSPNLFAIGACIASAAWFGSLTAFAPKLRVILSSPTRWRIFDASIALLLLVIAYQLLNIEF